MYRLGRTLQLLGLIILPLAILTELEGQLKLQQSLMLSAFGVILFSIGYLISGTGQR